MYFASISPELARLIQDQADSLGFPSAEAYLRVFFGQDAGVPPLDLSDAEFLEILDDLSLEDSLPTLPANFSRADIYSDHD